MKLSDICSKSGMPEGLVLQELECAGIVYYQESEGCYMLTEDCQKLSFNTNNCAHDIYDGWDEAILNIFDR
jgi:DNA-binding IclR family transcriptional regulator